MHASPKRSGRLAGPLVAAATWSLVGLAGCDSTPNAMDMGTNPDLAMVQPPGPPTKSSLVATVDRPLAAVLSPDAKTVFLTAHDANGLAQLYRVDSGGAPAVLNTGGKLIHPVGLGISPSGTTLYIVDSAGGSEDAGVVYSSDTTGALGGTTYTGVRAPAGVAVSADGQTVYITGFETASGQPGLFSASVGGGAVTAVAKGSPFSNPSAVTITADGTLYVVDTTALGPKLGAVIKVSGATATKFTTQALTVGFSAGIAPDGVGSNDLLVTGNTGLGSGFISNVSTAGAATPITVGTPLFDPATIHRAANVSAWVTVDSVNAMQASPATQQLGSVYLLTP